MGSAPTFRRECRPLKDLREVGRFLSRSWIRAASPKPLRREQDPEWLWNLIATLDLVVSIEPIRVEIDR